MKNVKMIIALICFCSQLGFAQKGGKEYSAKDLMPSGKRTCWDVTSGKAAFGNNICFNTNNTAQHATGGFGGFRIEKDVLSLKDLNGKSIDSQKKLVYTIKSVSKTKLVLIDDTKQTIELSIKK